MEQSPPYIKSIQSCTCNYMYTMDPRRGQNQLFEIEDNYLQRLGIWNYHSELCATCITRIMQACMHEIHTTAACPQDSKPCNIFSMCQRDCNDHAHTQFCLPVGSVLETPVDLSTFPTNMVALPGRSKFTRSFTL